MQPKIKPNEKVRAAMDIAGYTQLILARTIGVSKGAFNLKMCGKRDFSLSECQRIAKALGRTLDDIFSA